MSPEQTDLPDAAQLAAELSRMVDTGIVLPELEAIGAELQGLLSLPYVQRESRGPRAQLSALIDLLKQTWARLSYSPQGEVAGVILDLEPTSTGLPAERRRAEGIEIQAQAGIGRRSDISPAGFKRRREQPLLAWFATEMLLVHEEWVRRQEGKGGVRFADVNWLPRYEQYYRIWTGAYGLRADLQGVSTLQYRRRQPDHTESRKPARFILSSLYWFAWFSHEVAVNLRMYGGLFILTNAFDEQEAADAVAMIGHLSPFYMREESILIRALTKQRSMRLIDFETEVTANCVSELEEWTQWCETCQCLPDRPYEGCNLHKVIDHCRTFVKTVQESWYEIADWYGSLPTDLIGEDLAMFYKKADRWREEARLRSDGTPGHS